MAEDWLADVRKYAANADENVVAGIVRYLGIALRKRDSSLVAFSDAKETNRLRENFLKKKLALTDSDSVLDQAIAAVGQTMKADRTKNRVTVYYLLADNFGKLELFRKAPSAAKTAAGTGKASTGAAKSGAAKSAAVKSGTAKSSAASRAPAKTAAAAAAAAVPTPPPPAAASRIADVSSSGDAGSAARSASDDEDKGGGLGWLLWLLLALVVVALLYWLWISMRGQ